MWESRKDKIPGPQFYADVIAHLVRAYPHAAIDREVILGLRDFFVNEWRKGQSGRDAASATCSCDGKQIVPSPAAALFLAKRSALPPKGARRGTPDSPPPVFGLEDLREPAFLTRMRRELRDAERSFSQMSAELDTAAAARRDQLLVARGQVARRIQELTASIQEILATSGLLNPPPLDEPRPKRQRQLKEPKQPRRPKTPKGPKPPKEAKPPKEVDPPKEANPPKEAKPKAPRPPSATKAKRIAQEPAARRGDSELQAAASMLLSLVHDEKKAVLLGANPYGIPSIQDVVGAEHEGMGSFKVALGAKYLRFEGGGAMSHVGPLSYTILRGPVELAKFRDGSTGYPFERVEAALRGLATSNGGSGKKERQGKSKSVEAAPKKRGRAGAKAEAADQPGNPIDQSELVNLLAAELAGDQSAKGN